MFPTAFNAPCQLTGISQLVNKNEVNKNIDIEKVENDFIKNIDNDLVAYENLLESTEESEEEYTNYNVTPNFTNIPREEYRPQRKKDNNYIQEVLNVYGGEDFNEDYIDDEKEQIIIERLVREMEMLLLQMSDSKVDLEDYENAVRNYKNYSRSELEILHMRLKERYNVLNSGSIGKEIIMSLAEIGAYFFDGSREVFGTKPNLTGWPNVCRVKLNKLDYEVSAFTADILGTNMSHGKRIALELVPSFLLHLRRNSSSNDQKIENKMTDVLSDLNRYEEE